MEYICVRPCKSMYIVYSVYPYKGIQKLTKTFKSWHWFLSSLSSYCNSFFYIIRHSFKYIHSYLIFIHLNIFNYIQYSFIQLYSIFIHSNIFNYIPCKSIQIFSILLNINLFKHIHLYSIYIHSNIFIHIQFTFI